VTGEPSIEDRAAAQLRGFGPAGIVSILVVLAGALVGGWAAGALVLFWAYRSRTPWRDLGLARPRRWILTASSGLLFGGLFKLFTKSVLLPLLGGSPINSAYHYLVGNTAALPGLIFYILVSGAIGEELFYRGYLFERISRFFGTSTAVRIATVVFTALLFGLAHFADQGRNGVVLAVITGGVFGTVYAAAGGLWFVMFAHAGFDLTAVAIIYYDLESRMSHWLFR
jgi:membrane protease YdiL (CAAX protease family)